MHQGTPEETSPTLSSPRASIGAPAVRLRSEQGALHVDLSGPFAEHGQERWPLRLYYGSWRYRILYWRKGSRDTEPASASRWDFGFLPPKISKMGGSGGHQAQLGGAGPAGAMDSVLCASAGADPRVEQDRAAEQGALRADNPQRCNPCVDHCDCSDGVHAGRGHSCHRLFLLQFLSVQTHQTCFLPFLHFPRTLERVSEQTPGAPQPLPPREELLVCDKLTVMAEQSQPSLKGLGTGPAGQQSSLRTLPKDTDSGVRKSPNILLVIPWTFGFVSLLLFSRKTPQANTASQTFDRIILFFKYKKLGSK
ncbi:interleukin-10 receptor subunit beta isoform X3 [Zonotrichia albicollis]|uniref:interleukin-10 receptor subunit beta isoform X3 n=1 Tax=Zonotrichia albicollis TaxID=44394 RepID=UPI003D80C3A8